MPTPDFTDDELAATAKAVDVHRQALVRKLERIGRSNQAERDNTLAEIRACSSASHKMRVIHDEQLAAKAS